MLARVRLIFFPPLAPFSTSSSSKLTGASAYAFTRAVVGDRTIVACPVPKGFACAGDALTSFSATRAGAVTLRHPPAPRQSEPRRAAASIAGFPTLPPFTSSSSSSMQLCTRSLLAPSSPCPRANLHHHALAACERVPFVPIPAFRRELGPSSHPNIVTTSCNFPLHLFASLPRGLLASVLCIDVAMKSPRNCSGSLSTTRTSN